MRKHRLAELLLVNVIGLPYEEAHEEACRWEHVMSEAVEQRVYELLGRPDPLAVRQPDPRPGRVRHAAPHTGRRRGAQPRLPRPRPGQSWCSRICESVQTDADVLRQLHAAGSTRAPR